jgi:heat shock protein HtpX
MVSSLVLSIRAVLSILLMIGFYALALGLSGSLLYLVYAEIVIFHQIHPKIALACVGAAFAILWSILPRWEPFRAPGPRLEAAHHPRLTAVLRDLAKSTWQSLPSEIYLIPQVNAFVASRGGLMGFFSRRVMGIGLPLLKILTVSELRAVLAHEFGHYYGGDVALGPWIYRTRSAIGRTIASFRSNSLIQLPFALYGTLFLKVTFAISRHQELSADQLSAKKVGSIPLRTGLRKLQAAALAYKAYWEDLGPILGQKQAPPLAEGLVRFMEAENTQKEVERIQTALAQRPKGSFDSHPPLAERVAAVQDLPGWVGQPQENPAADLFTNLPSLEKELLGFVLGDPQARQWPSVDWAGAGMKALYPAYKKILSQRSNYFKGITFEGVPAQLQNLVPFGRKFISPGQENLTPQQLSDMGLDWLSTAFAVGMADQGWTLFGFPGEKLWVEKDRTRLVPYDLLKGMKEGQLTAEGWKEYCERWGLTGKPLVPLVEEPGGFQSHWTR